MIGSSTFPGCGCFFYYGFWADLSLGFGLGLFFTSDTVYKSLFKSFFFPFFFLVFGDGDFFFDGDLLADAFDFLSMDWLFVGGLPFESGLAFFTDGFFDSFEVDFFAVGFSLLFYKDFGAFFSTGFGAFFSTEVFDFLEVVSFC